MKAENKQFKGQLSTSISISLPSNTSSLKGANTVSPYSLDFVRSLQMNQTQGFTNQPTQSREEEPEPETGSQGETNSCSRTDCDNMTSVGRSRLKSSRYRGVSKCSKDGRWQARIRVGKVVKYLGRFCTQEEAAAAYDRGAIRYHAHRAVTNFDKKMYQDVTIARPTDIAAEIDSLKKRAKRRKRNETKVLKKSSSSSATLPDANSMMTMPDADVKEISFQEFNKFKATGQVQNSFNNVNPAQVQALQQLVPSQMNLATPAGLSSFNAQLQHLNVFQQQQMQGVQLAQFPSIPQYVNLQQLAQANQINQQLNAVAQARQVQNLQLAAAQMSANPHTYNNYALAGTPSPFRTPSTNIMNPMSAPAMQTVQAVPLVANSFQPATVANLSHLQGLSANNVAATPVLVPSGVHVQGMVTDVTAGAKRKLAEIRSKDSEALGGLLSLQGSN